MDYAAALRPGSVAQRQRAVFSSFWSSKTEDTSTSSNNKPTQAKGKPTQSKGRINHTRAKYMPTLRRRNGVDREHDLHPARKAAILHCLRQKTTRASTSRFGCNHVGLEPTPFPTVEHHISTIVLAISKNNTSQLQHLSFGVPTPVRFHDFYIAVVIHDLETLPITVLFCCRTAYRSYRTGVYVVM